MSQYHVRFNYLFEAKILVSDIEYGGETKASFTNSSRVEYNTEQRKSYLRFLKIEITQVA